MRNGTNRIDGDDRKDREDEINEIDGIDGIDGKFPSSAALPFIPVPVHLNQQEINFLLEGFRFGLSQK